MACSERLSSAVCTYVDSSERSRRKERTSALRHTVHKYRCICKNKHHELSMLCCTLRSIQHALLCHLPASPAYLLRQLFSFLTCHFHSPSISTVHYALLLRIVIIITSDISAAVAAAAAASSLLLHNPHRIILSVRYAKPSPGYVSRFYSIHMCLCWSMMDGWNSSCRVGSLLSMSTL